MQETGVLGLGVSFRGDRRTRRSPESGGDESQEITMLTSRLSRTAALEFESLNRVASDPLPGDRTQSHRLHEPEHRINTIDPMTGEDFARVSSHPSLAGGI